MPQLFVCLEFSRFMLWLFFIRTANSIIFSWVYFYELEWIKWQRREKNFFSSFCRTGKCSTHFRTSRTGPTFCSRPSPSSSSITTGDTITLYRHLNPVPQDLGQSLQLQTYDNGSGVSFCFLQNAIHKQIVKYRNLSRVKMPEFAWKKLFLGFAKRIMPPSVVPQYQGLASFSGLHQWHRELLDVFRQRILAYYTG